MAISVIDIEKRDVTKTLALEESHFVDVKSTRVSPAKLTKALSVFANADGGELFIGVEEIKHALRKPGMASPGKKRPTAISKPSRAAANC